ncbi:DHA2 family efflux MFS transporter permease subunit [Kocuria soli]|uniref:DHA2 family efflux MFS transporter permease subunit n=1 Tax=Kocuria soli TaxID=2485125 RepID=A0A3N4AFW7_9MICC|nr:MDR family MFS transporter [Kocuria soli]ROZ65779.1 DHA2 family efflux MFS transporter permease subunit [Kocuria soli]
MNSSTSPVREPQPETGAHTLVGSATSASGASPWTHETEIVTPSAARPRDSEKPQQRLLPIFAGLMLAMLLAALNQTVLSTALPTIVGELDGVHQMQWVITGYILASTVMMPVYGKLGDLLGRKNLLLGAIVVFVAGSVVGALAPDITWLIVARVIQGIGGGGLMILSQTVIADVVPPRQRGRYMGIMGGVFALASVAGPLLGGWITEGPGWRWAFWMSLPLGLLAFAGVAGFLKLPRHRGPVKIDVLGMMLLAAATVAVILVATWGGHQYAWDSPRILGLIGAAVVLVAIFVVVERKVEEPVLPPALFANRTFVLSTVAGLFVGVAMFGALGYMPTYLQMVHGASATASGLLMIPMMGAMLITSTVSGQAVTKSGKYKKYPIVGMTLIAVAMVMLSLLKVSTPLWFVCTSLGVLGVGLGLSMQILVLAVQNVFPTSMVGTATAGNNFFRQVGATLGSAVVGGVFATRLVDLLTERMPPQAMAGAGNSDMSASLTPAVVGDLPEQIRTVVLGAYNDALVPIYLWLVPLVVIGAILMFFVPETPLRTSNIPKVEAKPQAKSEAASRTASKS